LAHRDYYDKSGVILPELFNNRVELSNPGGLVSAISEIAENLGLTTRAIEKQIAKLKNKD
jgi:predicted HTH transcriptional regulator